MADPVLLVEKKNGVTTLILNRPKQMNALSLELRWALNDTIAELRNDKETGVVILTGAGPGFCAGLDLKEMGDATQKSHAPEPPDPASLLRSLPVSYTHLTLPTKRIV